MNAKMLLLTFSVYLLFSPTLGQRQWVDQTTTAQEMRDLYTWYQPYYLAAAEAYAKFNENAHEIRRQLCERAYASGACSSPNDGTQDWGREHPSQFEE